MKRYIAYSLVCFVFLMGNLINPAYALLNLNLTQGLSGALPIAILPFSGVPPLTTQQSTKISEVIQADLYHSGRFQPLQNIAVYSPDKLVDLQTNMWRARGVDDILLGHLKITEDGRYQVDATLLDLYGGLKKRDYNQNHWSQTGAMSDASNAEGVTVLAKCRYIGMPNQWRMLAHRISDWVYKTLTGKPGVFSTHLAYVVVQSPLKSDARYQLELSDADGWNAKPLLISHYPIMSPAWSPDGQKIAYVSFEKNRPAIFVQQIQSGKREKVAAFSGIDGAPSWSPNAQSLALVLTRSGAPKIYVLNLMTHQLRQLTYGDSIDTEPAWSPDGQALVFTSNRGGSPQIYRLDLKNSQVERLTFDGNYNTQASFSKDGKKIALLHADHGLFSIATLDLISGQMTLLTPPDMNDSPTMSPNGTLVLYATRYQDRGILSMVSTDGQIRMRLPAQIGEVQSPAWSPF